MVLDWVRFGGRGGLWGGKKYKYEVRRAKDEGLMVDGDWVCGDNAVLARWGWPGRVRRKNDGQEKGHGAGEKEEGDRAI